MDAEEIRQEDDKLIVNDVARAVEERELIAYYQPIVELDTGKVVGAESLVRWTMPDGVVVPAAWFVPSLDRTDTIFGLDWYMAEDVSAFLAKVDGMPAKVPVSLNFSARHAQTSDFAATLKATVVWHNVPLDLVRVELSESIVLGGDPAVDALVNLVRELGIAVVADKCVQGVDGIAVAVARGVRNIKVSRDYWAGKDEAELSALVAAAAEHKVWLCAEGVESQDEVALLCSAGFKYAQGFYLGKPMDGEAFVRVCDEANR